MVIVTWEPLETLEDNYLIVRETLVIAGLRTRSILAVFYDQLLYILLAAL